MGQPMNVLRGTTQGAAFEIQTARHTGKTHPPLRAVTPLKAHLTLREQNPKFGLSFYNYGPDLDHTTRTLR